MSQAFSRKRKAASSPTASSHGTLLDYFKPFQLQQHQSNRSLSSLSTVLPPSSSQGDTLPPSSSAPSPSRKCAFSGNQLTNFKPSSSSTVLPQNVQSQSTKKRRKLSSERKEEKGELVPEIQKEELPHTRNNGKQELLVEKEEGSFCEIEVAITQLRSFGYEVQPTMKNLMELEGILTTTEELSAQEIEVIAIIHKLLNSLDDAKLPRESSFSPQQTKSPNTRKSAHGNRVQKKQVSFRCTQEGCSYSATHSSNLKRHVDGVHKKLKRLRCTEEGCDSSFAAKGDLTLHVNAVHKKLKPFCCPEESCGMYFANPSNLKRHVNGVHKKLKRFCCTEEGCDSSFAAKGDLTLHVNAVHKKLKRFRCTEEGCDLSFATKGEMTRHVNAVHKKLKPFCCTEEGCDLSFAAKGDLTQHVNRVHKKLKPFCCTEEGCDSYFATKSDLTRHVNTVHKKLKPFRCTEEGCDLSFATKLGRKGHVNAVHKKLKPFRCTEEGCDSSFSTKSETTHHVNAVHKKLRPFHCPAEGCDSYFATKGAMTLHVNAVHKKLRPFRCPEESCGIYFSHPSNLKVHVNTAHRNRKPFRCTEEGCGSTFQTQRRFIVHYKRVHEKIRNFACDCGCRFFSNYELKNHMERHDRAKDWTITCEYVDGGVERWRFGNGICCDKKFPSHIAKRSHIQNSHTVEGIQNKFSEAKLAAFLTKKKVPFTQDRANRISFQCEVPGVEFEKTAARPDFHLISESARLKAHVILENDEYGHDNENYSCDLKRIVEIVSAISIPEKGESTPVVFFRFNPHFFRKGKVRVQLTLQESHEKLVKIIQGYTKEMMKYPNGLNLVYINYSQDDPIEGDEPWQRLHLFQEIDPEADPMKYQMSWLLRDSVTHVF